MNILNITNYKSKDFAELLGTSVNTEKEYLKQTKLHNKRYYTYDKYL